LVTKNKEVPQKTRKVAAAAREPRRYRAPALEKGLEILELLAREPAALSTPQIANLLGRKRTELFRMMQVLEYAGYVAREDGSESYVLSNKLFALGMLRPPIRNLLAVALPVMRKLSAQLDQSCHLAVRTDDQIVVIAREEAPGDLGFAVRIGYRRSLVHVASGVVLFAFQPQSIQDAWLRRLRSTEDPAAIAQFARRVEIAQKKGFEQQTSEFVQGISDLSAPILHGESAIAALTVPFVQSQPIRKSIADAIPPICAAAADISRELSGGPQLNP
jgi:DNA-binding IclR family transcriptional regulator